MNTLLMLIVVIHQSIAKECVVQNAVQACADYSDPLFGATINSYGSSSYKVQDKGFLLVGEKPLGVPLGLPYKNCIFPNRMGRNSAHEPESGKRKLSLQPQLYHGFLTMEDLGESPVCHAYCSEAFCPDIVAPSCRTLLVTFEGSLTGNNALAFLGKLGLINPLTKVTCYLKKFDSESLNQVKYQKGLIPTCSKILLELAYNWIDKKACPFNPDFPNMTDLNSKYSPVYLIIPAFGYKLTTFEDGFKNEICKGSFDRVSNFSHSGVCLLDKLTGCGFASPEDVWQLVQEQYDKRNTQGFYLLSAGLLKSSNSAQNQIAPVLTPEDILRFIEGPGRQYALSDEQSNCKDVLTDSIDSCVWVETIDVDDSGFCVGEDLETGYVGEIVCDFSCEKEFEAVVCDIMTCHELQPPPKSNIYFYWSLDNQIVIESGGQYAWADREKSRHCLGEGRFLVCQGNSVPEVLCSASECWLADFQLAPLARLGKICQTASCVVNQKPVTSRHLLQLEAISDCKSQLTQEGAEMKLLSLSKTRIKSLCIQSADQRKCKECEEAVCILTVDLDFAKLGEEVLSDCDGVITPLMWATKYNMGEKVGMPQLDYLMTAWSSAERYWKWILVFALLAFVQMTLWTVKTLGLHHILKKTFVCIYRVIFSTPSFFKEIWRNFFWFRRRYHFCPGCGGDLNFLDHTEETCIQTEHYCKFLISGGICGDTISESQAHFRHWVLLHLPAKVMKIPFWINPLNIWKFYQVKLTHIKLPTKRHEIEEKKNTIRGLSNRPYKSKGYPTPLLGVAILSIAGLSEAVVNLAPSVSCSKGICIVTTSGVMDNLYSGSLSCFKASSEGANLEFCLSVKSVLITGTAQVIKCRVEPDIKFFGTFRCTNAWAESWYKGELESYKDCTPFASRNEARVGGYDWGCSLPNANSIFVKGYLADSKLPTPCIVDTTGGWSVKTILCISAEGILNCDYGGEGKVTQGSLNISYTTEFPGKISLPERLLVMPDGTFRKVLDDQNGCFLFSKKKIGGRDCTYPISFPSYACGYTVDPTGVAGHCIVPNSKVCEDPLSYPLFNSGSCFLASAVPSLDSNSFLISGKGCTDGTSSLRFEAVGTIEVAPVSGSVVSLEVHDCLGYSGISSGASCLIYPKCDGKITICSLVSPTVFDVPCHVDTRVFFSGSDKSNVTFRCGNAAKSLSLNLTIVMPQKDTQNLISSSVNPAANSAGNPAGFTFLIVVAVAAFLALTVWISFIIAKKVKEIKSSTYPEKML